MVVKIAINQSPSSRGRGLKYVGVIRNPIVVMSPSSRGRGLKFDMFGWSYDMLTGRPLHEGVD